MAYDVIIVFEDSDGNETDRLTLACEQMSYNVDRRIKVYEIPIFKALSEALGDIAWTNWMTDWGVTVETFTLKGVINEGSKYDSLVKMMEYSDTARIQGFLAAKNLLYIGADPDDPTTLSKFAVRNVPNTGDDSTRKGMDKDKGLEGKINKFTFDHVGNLTYVSYTLEFIVGMDFEILTGG